MRRLLFDTRRLGHRSVSQVAPPDWQTVSKLVASKMRFVLPKNMQLHFPNKASPQPKQVSPLCWRWILVTNHDATHTLRFRDLLSGRHFTIDCTTSAAVDAGSHWKWIQQGMTVDPKKQYALATPSHVCFLMGSLASREARLLQKYAAETKKGPGSQKLFHVSLDKLLQLNQPKERRNVLPLTSSTTMEDHESALLGKVTLLCGLLPQQSDMEKQQEQWRQMLSEDGVMSPRLPAPSPTVPQPEKPACENSQLFDVLRQAVLPVVDRVESVGKSFRVRLWKATHVKGALRFDELDGKGVWSGAKNALPAHDESCRSLHVVVATDEICRVLLSQCGSLSQTDAVIFMSDLQKLTRSYHFTSHVQLPKLLLDATTKLTVDEWRSLLRQEKGTRPITTVLRKPKASNSEGLLSSSVHRRLSSPSNTAVPGNTTDDSVRIVSTAPNALRDHWSSVYGSAVRLERERDARRAFLSTETLTIVVKAQSDRKTILQRVDHPFAKENVLRSLKWRTFANCPATTAEEVGNAQVQVQVKALRELDLVSASQQQQSSVLLEELNSPNVTVLGSHVKQSTLFLHRLYPSAVQAMLTNRGCRLWCVFYAQYLLSGFRSEFQSVAQLHALYYPSQTKDKPLPVMDEDEMTVAVFHAQLSTAVRSRTLIMIRERMEGLLASVAMEIAGVAVAPTDVVLATKEKLSAIHLASHNLLQRFLHLALKMRLNQPSDEQLLSSISTNFNWRSAADVALFLFGGGMVHLLGRLPRVEIRWNQPLRSESTLFQFLQQNPSLPQCRTRAQSSVFVVINVQVKDNGLITLLSVHIPNRESVASLIAQRQHDFFARVLSTEVLPLPHPSSSSKQSPLLSLEDCKRQLKGLARSRVDGLDGDRDIIFFVAGEEGALLHNNAGESSFCRKCTALVESGIIQAMAEGMGKVRSSDISVFPLPIVEAETTSETSSSSTKQKGASAAPTELVVDFGDFQELEKGDRFMEAQDVWRERIACLSQSSSSSPPTSRDPTVTQAVRFVEIRSRFYRSLGLLVGKSLLRTSRPFAEGRGLEEEDWLTTPRCAPQERVTWPGIVWMAALRHAVPEEGQLNSTTADVVSKVLEAEADEVGGSPPAANPPSGAAAELLQLLRPVYESAGTNGVPSVGVDTLEAIGELFQRYPSNNLRPLKDGTSVVDAIHLLLQQRAHEKTQALFAPERLLLSGIASPYTTAPPKTLLIHGEVLHTKTNTGRLASQSPCMHNIPKQRTVRSLFPSRFGAMGCYVEADYTQLEVVALAVLSRDEQMLRELRQQTDFHCMRVSLMQKVPYEHVVQKVKVEKDETYIALRQSAKVFSFQRQYGAGIDSISKSTGMSKTDVAQLIAAEERHYPQLTAYYQLVAESIRKGNESSLPFRDDVRTSADVRRTQLLVEPRNHFMTFTGTKYHFPPDASIPLQKNHPVQGFAGELVQMMCGRVMRLVHDPSSSFFNQAYLVNCVHDCVWIDCKTAVSDSVAAAVQSEMEAVVSRWRLLYGEPAHMIPDVAFPVTVHRGSTLGDLAPIATK